MRRLRILGPVVVVAALAGAAPATAAPPTAQDDSLSASPSGALDVLANDSGDPAGSVRVLSNSQPANGTASCAPLGGCLYTAANGFTGSDSFTYVARAGNGEQDTATVSVTVTAPSGARVPIARDDDVATLAGRAVTVDVLANDEGTGLTVTANGASEHGSVSCSPTGGCTYTPAAGYVGTDGFTYRIRDGASRTSDAAVHVIVAPADAGHRVGIAAGARNPIGGAVPGGGTADWAASVAALPAGISGEALRALAPPSASVAPGGPHAVTGTRTAKGWTAADGGLRADATDDALLGDSSTRTFPRPLPPISQGSGGDGHVPILVGSKVFAFFHHQFPTQVTCVDRATGELCPGYPKQTNMGSTDINGPAAVVGSRMYTHLEPGGGYAQSAPIALYCWDAATDSTCGLIVVDRVERTSNPGASAAVLVAGKVWFGGDTGLLYCVDPATNAPCASPSIATGMDSSATERLYDIVTHGSRVFLARSSGPSACVDVSAGTTCPGWATPKTFAGNSWNLVTQRSAAGSAVGICVFQVASSPNVGECISDADAGTRVPITNYVAVEPYAAGYSVTQEGEAGSRTLVPSLSRNGLGCYDWATMAPCTGGAYAADGWISQDGEANSLPSAYGAVFDGSCVVAVGDPGQIFTVDPAGASPCLSLDSGADRVAIDLRDQRCDATVGAARWKAIRLSDVDGDELEFVRVTVRNAETGEVVREGDLVGSGGVLDLSGVDPAQHPALTVDATAKSSAEGDGTAAWADGIPPRLTVEWSADPTTLCVVTKAEDRCNAPAQTPITMLARLLTPSTGSAEGQLQLLRGTCPVASSAVLGTKLLPAKRTCGSRRSFIINIRIRGKDVRSISVTVGNKKQKLLRRNPRPVARIDLKGQSVKKLRVKIVIRTKAGKRLQGTRTYNPCTKKLRGTGFRF